jgi:hypothetical protein
MSLLNLGLQNVSLERKRVSDKVEAILSSCNSMSMIRDAAEREPEVKAGWTESVQPLQSTIMQRFIRLKLKNESVVVKDPVTDDEIDVVKRHLRELFPQLDTEKLQKVHTKKVEDYNAWVAKHCKLSHYIFQIRKCGDLTCCSPSTLPQEELSWLPDPILKDPDHYKSYQELKGIETTEADRPSLSIQKTKPKCNADKKKTESLNIESTNNSEDDERDIPVPLSPPDLYTVQNARAIATCIEYRKPRVIYSKHRLTERQQTTVITSMSEYDFSCGAVLLPPSNPLHGKVMTRSSLTCESPVELAYYSSGLGQTDLCCCCCNAGEVNQELKKSYKTVLPLCQECASDGKEPITQRPYGKKN